MYNQQVILELVGRIYDAALDPGCWATFLTRLADVTQGTSAVIYMDVSFKASNVAAAIRLDPHYLSLYEQHYVKVNVLTPRSLKLISEGGVAMRQTVCSDEEMLKTEYYNDFLRPLDVFHSMNGLILNREPAPSHIDVFRPRTAEAFDDEDLDLLKTLMPHLQRALSVHQRIATLEGHQKAAEEAIDQLPMGVILQDGRGKIISMNRAAQAILGQKDGLNVNGHGLQATSRQEDQQLRTMILEACQASLGVGFGSGGAMPISRPSLRRSYALLVSPLPHDHSLFGMREGTVAVFIADLETQNETLDEVLRSVFGLTRAESKIAALLAQGKSLEQACEGLFISCETGRTHLKRIFSKTETSRQGELIRLILKCPATPQPSGSHGQTVFGSGRGLFWRASENNVNPPIPDPAKTNPRPRHTAP
ncbi:MAG: helix-turn-helix transcriptional regulator [Terriglobia bacterium]